MTGVVVTGRTGVTRLGVLFAYVFNGLALAAWSVRLPSIRADLDLDAADLGVFLTAGACGTLVMVTAAGMLVSRFGARSVYAGATAVYAAAYLLLGLAPGFDSFPMLLAANVVHGVAFALTNVPQSILAAESERRVGRTILPQFHAGYSIGAALGAALGGLAAASAVTVLAQFLGLAVVAVVVRTVVHRLVTGLERREIEVSPSVAAAVDAEPVPRGRHPFAVWADPQVLLLGALILAAGFSEGTANNWLPLAVVDALEAPESDGALGLSVFLVAQTVLRLVGGPLVDRFGRLAILRASGVVTVLGVTGFALAPTLPFALVAVAAWGAGAALAVPICISAAAADPRRGTARVAAVTSLSSVANIAGPPLIGVLSGALGIRGAIACVAVAIVLALLGARRAVARR